MISYFCVSTEQRFINMSSEKERHNGAAGSLIEKTNRSLLNHSGQSQSIKSAGMSPGLNSTLGKSTKTST